VTHNPLVPAGTQRIRPQAGPYYAAQISKIRRALKIQLKNSISFLREIDGLHLQIDTFTNSIYLHANGSPVFSPRRTT